MAITTLAVLVTLTFASPADSQQESDSCVSPAALLALESRMEALEAKLANDCASKSTVDKLQSDLQATDTKMAQDYALKSTVEKDLHAMETKIAHDYTLKSTVGKLQSDVDAIERKIAQDYALKSDLQALNTTIADDYALKSTVGKLQIDLHALDTKMAKDYALKAKVTADIRALNTTVGGHEKVVSFRAEGATKIYEDSELKFEEVRENNGDGYDPSTGYFTAPAPGVYILSFKLSYRNKQPGYSNSLALAYYQAGLYQVILYSYLETDEGGASVTCAVTLDPGQMVHVRVLGKILVYGSVFSGLLVKPL